VHCLPTICHEYHTLYFCVRIVLVTKFYFGTESVLTLISALTSLLSLCVIVLHLSVCVLYIRANFVIGLVLLKRALWKFSNNNNNNNNNNIYSKNNGNVRNTFISL
jgi:hypothetical protein